MNPPKVLLKECTIVHGYRGHPKVYILLACGHHEFRDEHGARWKKFVVGKTKLPCWDCRRTEIVREALVANGGEFRKCHGQESPCFEPCEKCNGRTPFEIKVMDRWAAWCGCK